MELEKKLSLKVKVLKEIAKQHQFKLVVEEYDFASCDYYEKHGKMLPDDWQEN
jgi:Isocitrate/isopropylmalate dehydrogenase